MADFPPDETINAQPWLAVPRGHDIRLILIHATRGATSQELQYQATKNWMQSAGNRINDNPPWGGSCNRIISHEGQMCTVWPDNMQPTWSCGFGGSNTWAIDWYAISFELAQSADQEPFAEPTITRLAIEVAHLCTLYNIPPVWLPSVDQTGAVLAGITGHENTDNGRKLGKTDPGTQFPIEAFLAAVQQHMGEQPFDPVAWLNRVVIPAANISIQAAAAALREDWQAYRELASRQTAMVDYLKL